jgi:peptidoglycan/LPS O-acetylase OafA/YrhL
VKKINRILKHLLRRPGSGKNILKEIEGLRFIAIFLVLIQHLSERMLRFKTENLQASSFDEQASFLVSRGTIGVFLFFAISGFIISLPMLKRSSSNPLEGYGQYLQKRFWRIEAPYLIWMSIFALVFLVKMTSESQDLFWHYLASITYLHNILYQDYSIINPVAWSLEIEIQFYLMAPFLVWSINQIPGSIRKMTILFGTILLILALQYQFNWWHFPVKATLLGQLQHFLVGILMAMWYQQHRESLKKSYLYDFIFVIALLVMAYTWTTELTKNLLFTVALILLFISAFRSIIVARFLRMDWIVIIGGMCYTIYLVHLPLLEGLIRVTRYLSIGTSYLPNLGLQMLLQLPLIGLISLIGYILIEKPFMQFQRNGWNAFTFFRKWKKVPAMAFARKSIYLLLICLPVLQANGQEQAAEKLNQQLRPLPELISTAVANAHLLQQKEAEIAGADAKISLLKKQWTNHFTANGSVNYGTGTIIDNAFDGTLNSIQQLNRSNLFYSVGVGFRVPLGEFLNRGEQQNILMAEKQSLQKQKMAQQQTLEEIVTVKYFALKQAGEMFEQQSEILEANRMALELAEKYFQAGKMQVDVYKTTLEEFYQSKSDFATARLNFLQAYELLTILVGEEIIQP